MCCGVVPILFGWFLSVSSLHVLVFIRKIFCDLFLLFFFKLVFRNSKTEERWVRKARGRCMISKV